MTVFEKISQQQEEAKKKKSMLNMTAYCVGETLKKICSEDADCASIVAEDLESESMSIMECAKKNLENADRVRKETKENVVNIPAEEEERIIREFYGLPAAAIEDKAPPAEEPKLAVPDLFSFF